MALLPGSPAIDAGNNALIPAGVTTDQRGAARASSTARSTSAPSSRAGSPSPSPREAASRPACRVLRPAGRDGHRQQPDRARGRGPGHIHPAGERGVGDDLTGSPATISANGTASVTAATNGIGGSYTVSATASGARGRGLVQPDERTRWCRSRSPPAIRRLAVGVAGQFTATGTFADGSTAGHYQCS